MYICLFCPFLEKFKFLLLGKNSWIENNNTNELIN